MGSLIELRLSLALREDVLWRKIDAGFQYNLRESKQIAGLALMAERLVVTEKIVGLNPAWQPKKPSVLEMAYSFGLNPKAQFRD